MSKYWGKNYFARGSLPEVGQKQKTEKKVGDNNGQATHGARKHAWRTQAAWAKMHEIRCRRWWSTIESETIESETIKSETIESEASFTCERKQA